MVTIDMVAKKAGVSKAAVSYAFSGSKKISENTRRRILQVAAEMNYFPNRNAQLLRKEKSRRVGLFIPRFSGSYYMYLVESISMALEALGYQLVINFLRGTNEERIADIAGANIDAAIIHAVFDDGNYYDRLASVMEERGTPMVYLIAEPRGSRCSGVGMNDFSAFSWMVDHLVEMGHKKIIYADDEVQMYMYNNIANCYRGDLDKIVPSWGQHWADSINPTAMKVQDGTKDPDATCKDLQTKATKSLASYWADFDKKLAKVQAEWKAKH